MSTRQKMLALAVGAFSLAAVFAVPSLPVARAAVQDAGAATYSIDPVHSTVQFRIVHLGVSAHWGRIDDPAGSFTLSGSDLKLEVTLDTNKVDTDNAKRDEHVKGPDFFNVVEFPQATFKSKSSKVTGDTYEVTGDLTIKGRTKEVTIPFKKIGEGDRGPQFGYRAGFEGELTINRMDYGVDGIPQGLGADVKLVVSIEGVRK